MNIDRLQQGFRIGEWTVDPKGNRLQRNCESSDIEPRAMDLLVFLASRAGTTASKEEIFEAVWANTFVTDSALWKCVSELRRVLEEDPRNPKLILTVPRRGYRLQAAVEKLSELRSDPGPNARINRRWLFAAGILIGIGFLIVLALWVGRSDKGPAPAGSADRPTVLLAPLDNRTGDLLLDGTLEVVLEGRLNDSGKVQVVSRARVEDSLKLMRWPPNTPLSTGLARKVSLRDGEVDFLVSGQIDDLGSRYHVTLRLLDGQSHELVASNDLGTDSREGLLTLVNELAFWLIGQLGDEGPDRTDKPERVTTTSIEALSLYTRGVAEYLETQRQNDPLPKRFQKYGAAARLFEEATQIDPEFSSAHLMLAWSRVMMDRHDPQRPQEVEVVYRGTVETGREDVVTRSAWDAMEQAMSAREYASLVERAFIQGCYLNWKGDYREAVPYYRLAVELEPEHHWAAANLAALGRTLDDSDIYIEGQMHLYRGRRDFQGWALRTIVQTAGKLEAAQEIRERAGMMLGAESDPMADALTAATVEDLPHASLAELWAFDVWSLWQQERYAEARVLLETLARHVSNLDASSVDVSTNGYGHYLAGLQIGLGLLQEGRATQKRYNLHYQVENWASWICSPGILLAFLEETGERPRGETVDGWPRMYFDRSFAAAWKPDNRIGETWEELARILTFGTTERIDGLRAWLDRHSGILYRQDTQAFFGVRWFLARDLLIEERLEEARKSLEEIIADRNRTWVGGIVIWQKAAMDLIRVYRKLGSSGKAEKLASELAEMLQSADPDHPILGELSAEPPPPSIPR
ncbi:MAG: winged helix-turn-helix domain-containing protein [Acidobacteriota bacterium]|nr:MAG: winged helix-turn-helix domain-containing protein [Acidobacteriota bacterium]